MPASSMTVRVAATGILQVGEQSGGVTSRHLLIEHGLEREQGSGPARTGQVGGGNGLLRGEGLEVECALRLTGAAVTPGHCPPLTAARSMPSQRWVRVSTS